MEKIKTKLKFIKSERTGSWVGFVSINTKNGCIKGVREDASEPKKVCVATHELSPIIEVGVLYDVEMIPMKNKNAGFIVVSAEPHAFEAKIYTNVVKNAVYNVEVKFGNKTYRRCDFSFGKSKRYKKSFTGSRRLPKNSQYFTYNF